MNEIKHICSNCRVMLERKNTALKELLNEVLNLYKMTKFNSITINSNTPGVDFDDLKQEIKAFRDKLKLL